MLKQVQKGTGAFDARSYGGQIALKMLTFDFSGVTSYTTDGVPCNIGAFFNGRAHAAFVAPKNGYVFEYVPSTSKVKAYYADYDAGADGPLVEVAAGADLSAIGEVDVLAWGVM